MMARACSPGSAVESSSHFATCRLSLPSARSIPTILVQVHDRRWGVLDPVASGAYRRCRTKSPRVRAAGQSWCCVCGRRRTVMEFVPGRANAACATAQLLMSPEQSMTNTPILCVKIPSSAHTFDDYRYITGIHIEEAPVKLFRAKSGATRQREDAAQK
jgi:hypothetical protein